MKFKTPALSIFSRKTLSKTSKPLMASTIAQTQTLHSDPPVDLDDTLSSGQPQEVRNGEQESPFAQPDAASFCSGPPSRCFSGQSHIERAWSHWSALGRPKLIVAPMVDNSELPFRMLCRKYGAEAAYTPMLHSRIFTENDKYRSQEFTTCKVIFSTLIEQKISLFMVFRVHYIRVF